LKRDLSETRVIEEKVRFFQNFPREFAVFFIKEFALVCSLIGSLVLWIVKTNHEKEKFSS